MRSYPNQSFLLLFVSDPVRIYMTTISGGGESIESNPVPKPNVKATLTLLSSPFSMCCSNGPDGFSRPFPPYHITSIHSTSPEHALSEDIDVNGVDDDNDADIRALVIRDVKQL